jgi:hypothetical protein
MRDYLYHSDIWDDTYDTYVYVCNVNVNVHANVNVM